MAAPLDINASLSSSNSSGVAGDMRGIGGGGTKYGGGGGFGLPATRSWIPWVVIGAVALLLVWKWKGGK